MPPKSNQQRATTPEAAEGNINPVLKNTPIKAGRNSDYHTDLTKAILEHIQRNIFHSKATTLEPDFCKIFLDKAPQLNISKKENLEGSLGVTIADLVFQISSSCMEKDMYQRIMHLLSGLTLLVEIDDDDWCLSLPKDHLCQAIEISTCTPQAADDHPGHISIGSIAAMQEDICQFVQSKEEPKEELKKKPLFTTQWDSLGYVGEAKAGGYSPEGQVVVVKLVWRQSGGRLNEAEVSERVHKNGLVAGIVTLLGDHNDSPHLYELLPNEAESDATYIRQMLLYDMIGESLSSCGSIKTFLIAMFDLVEILRFINTKRHLLHRDVSWSNILLNPHQISGTHKPHAEEQPESFAKFINPSYKDTFQHHHVNGIMTQHLGTVTLLDLELAAELDPTKVARVGVDTMDTPMFIAMDRLYYRDMPNFYPWFFSQHEQFFAEAPETSSEPDFWIRFWKEAAETMVLPSIPTSPPPQELPLHDVKPVFWVIVLFFI
ncbi:hypothetical protein JB92DRAFT_3123903 [Gautieria morchelliformis]|nr:hypothetical protein JB92DRAFT_3123903 [Gautieria morchelliformis]